MRHFITAAALAAAAVATLVGASPASAQCRTVGLQDPDHHVEVCTTVSGTTVSATVDVCPDWHFPCTRVVDLGQTGAALQFPSVGCSGGCTTGVKVNSTTQQVYVNGTQVTVPVPGVCVGPTGFC